MNMSVLGVGMIDELPHMAWAEKLAYLTFRFHQIPQVECALEHSFECGQYIRTIAIPKGTLFIGRIHRVGHGVELLKGSVIHVKEHCRRLVQAPFCMTTSPGDQVCALALTDIVARTVHPAGECADIEKLEELFFETTESLRQRGEQVDQRLRKLIYERSSSSDSRWRSDSGSRVSCSRI